MLADFIEQYPEATLVLAQTTYLQLAIERALFRVDLLDKTEFRLKPGVRGALAYYTQHPLLLDYNQPSATLYLSSRSDNAQALLHDLSRAVASASQNWRALPRYLFGFSAAGASTLVLKNLADGSGILLESAPAEIVRAVITTCEQHGVTTYFRGSINLELKLGAELFSIPFIGSCYVIARSFLVRPV
ncbi:MAG: hypothetical protein ACRYG7_54585 [Janthinobacterium lividum]